LYRYPLYVIIKNKHQNPQNSLRHRRKQERMRTLDTITAWTRQVPEVLDELHRNGVYRVREEYIRIKNDTIADYYLKLYDWYTAGSRKYVRIPDGARYPIWFSLAEDYRLQPIPGTVILKTQLPRDQILIIDIEKWEYRGNDLYVPADKADEKRFREELLRYGISDETSLIETNKGNFYPLLKRMVTESWERIFTMPPENPPNGFATSWELKEEWVTEVIQNG